VPDHDRVTQTSAYLRMLLLRPGEYRTLWERRAGGTQPGTIDTDAVAGVLAEAHGDSGSDLVGLARGALDGTGLTPDTLGQFIAAFGIGSRHATRLWDLMRGSDSVRVISGQLNPTDEAYVRADPPRYETLSLHELHVLGPDGAPAEHQTIQVIKSTVDGLGSYPYRFDTDELVVDVIRGGRIGDHIYRVSDTLYAVDIVLNQPLATGETTLIQLRTTFFYKTPPEPEFRRGVLRTTNDVTIWVKFHKDRVPKRVWSARWDRVDHARIVDRQQVELDEELSVHGRFGSVERAIVGFYWEWA
jgi:hypothetical protein